MSPVPPPMPGGSGPACALTPPGTFTPEIPIDVGSRGVEDFQTRTFQQGGNPQMQEPRDVVAPHASNLAPPHPGRSGAPGGADGAPGPPAAPQGRRTLPGGPSLLR